MKIDIEGALVGDTIVLKQLRKILVDIHNKNLERIESNFRFLVQ